MSATSVRTLLAPALLLGLIAGCTATDAPKEDKPETKVAATPDTKKVEAKPETKKAEAPKPLPPPAEPAPKYKKGQLARAGLSAEDVLEYNKAQGDPMQKIDLKTALAGDPVLEDVSKGKLFAEFDTTMGKFRCELYEDKAPNTVANFVGLGRGVRPFYDKKTDEWKTGPFYDGIIFHRVIPGFMIQTGDPLGAGTGGPGYLIADEFDKSLQHVGAGILSMANRGVNTGSSQFFVTVAATPHLNDKHAIFGKCDPKVAIKISEVKTRSERPLDEVKINKLTFTRAKK